MGSNLGRRNTRTTAVLSALVACVAAFVHADPVVLKTIELGHGPTIVMVHSVGASRNDWLPTARRLLGRYRVVLVDLPGHGDSPMPDPFSFARVADALDAVLAKQSPDSTIVVGHQIGGRVVVSTLALHPGRAKGLVLIDTPLNTPRPLSDEQRNRFLDAMDNNYDLVAKFMYGNMGSDTTQSRAIWATFSQTPAATVKAYFREMLYTDGNKDARALKLPVEYVFTSLVWTDSLTSWGTFRLFGWQDTRAAAVRIPNAAFWVMKDQPDTLAAIIGSFAAARIAAR